MEHYLSAPDGRDMLFDFTPTVYKDNIEAIDQNVPQQYIAEIIIQRADIDGCGDEDAGSITASIYYPLRSSTDDNITFADDNSAFNGYAMTALSCFLDKEDYVISDFQCIFIVQEVKLEEKYQNLLMPVIAERLDEILRETNPLLKTFVIAGSYDESDPISKAFKEKDWRIIDTPDTEDESCPLFVGYTPQRSSFADETPGFAGAASLSPKIREYLAKSEIETLKTIQFIEEEGLGAGIADIATSGRNVSSDALAAQMLSLTVNTADLKGTLDGFHTDWQRIVRYLRHMDAACEKND